MVSVHQLLEIHVEDLARIVDRHIKEALLTLAPLHEKQYAYRAVRSTVAAFHHLARRLNQCLCYYVGTATKDPSKALLRHLVSVRNC